MPRFGAAFLNGVRGEIEARNKKERDRKGKVPEDGFEVEVPEGFAEVPVFEVARIVGNSDEDTGIRWEDEVLLMRYCTLGRKVVLYYDGKEIGTVVPNDMKNDWNAFEVFTRYPLALRYLMNVCTAYVLKKSIPPRRDDRAQAGAPGSPGPGK